MFKKTISLGLVLIMVCSLWVITFAQGGRVDIYQDIEDAHEAFYLMTLENTGTYGYEESRNGSGIVREHVQIGDTGYEFLLDSVIYTNHTPVEDDTLGTRSVHPGYGSVRIDDVIMDSSSITDVASVNYAKYEAVKYTSIRILKKVPGIGDVYLRLEDIYNDLCAVRDALKSIDTQRAVKVETKYSTRGFAHKLYVYDHNNSWKDMGYSLSRYYYKHLWMLGYTSDGEVVGDNYDYTHSNGYPPAVIAKASHYMDKSWLSSTAIDYWKYNRGRYVETY